MFYWIEEPDRGKAWMTSVAEAEIIKETSNKIGTTFREYVQEDGQGIEMYGTIKDFIPNKKFSVHLESHLNSVDVDFILEEILGQTILTQHMDIRFKGKLKLLSLFISGTIKKKINRQTRSEFAKL